MRRHFLHADEVERGRARVGPPLVHVLVAVAQLGFFLRKIEYLAGIAQDQVVGFLFAFGGSGELGVATGKGFYTYPDPAYERPGWLKGGS